MRRDWEAHAGWWQEYFTDGADPEYEEQILPLVDDHLAGCARVLDVGCGEGQLARRIAALGGEVVGHRPDRGADRRGPAPRRRSAVRPGFGAALPFASASFDAVVACLVLEHIEPFEPAIDEIARVLAPGGRFVLLPEPPAAPDAGQRLDRRPHPRGAVLAGRALPPRRRRHRRGRPRRQIALHASPARPIHQRDGRSRAAGRAHGRTAAVAGLRGPAPEYGAAASIPRLLVVRTRKRGVTDGRAGRRAGARPPTATARRRAARPWRSSAAMRAAARRVRRAVAAQRPARDARH